ncbi:zf-DHHC-domain-containing protein [Dacryopinax primogenitus]|uniref:Palmitoyltransferase n=1 Tax=Dacryopinax primogenitus (strain DJM 731) TaxID=1858805 RepID=M5G5M9_DACPD|nr:zf-DHHC-domain-containing protein [Dacryopinax primogenitus]EJU05566.1 zf-DHHC-domain-containing protein [Dacryopinax primogenitus]
MSSTSRKVIDPTFLYRPPSITVSRSDRPIPMSTLGRHPSGRSAHSSRSGASGLHSSRRRERAYENNLPGYQSDGYLSDGPRSGYGSDGPRSGYGSDGPRSGYGSDGPRGYVSDTGRIKRMLPIGPDRSMAVHHPSLSRRHEPDLPLAGDRRSWDNRWAEHVETMAIGRGAGERRRSTRLTDTEEEKNIGFGMIVPEDVTPPDEPSSPQEPARSQYGSERRYGGSVRDSPNVRTIESLQDEEMTTQSGQTSAKRPHFAPLPPPASKSQKVTFSYGDTGDKTHIPLAHKATGPRNYEGYPSRNSFYFRGHILTGGDNPWPFIASLNLCLVVAGIWLAGVGRNCGSVWGNRGWAILAVGCYGIALVLTSMLVTAFRDPGIVPRDLDPDPPYSTSSVVDGEEPIPLPRDLRARSGIVRVKYCSTCKTYRPPRASHCKVCDNCVDGIDHHCTYLHNCVGRRNYTTFMTFLMSAVLTLCYVIVTSALELYSLSFTYDGFASALRAEPLAGVSFALGIIVIWPMSALLAYHIRLQVLNITTVEQVRAQAHRSMIPGPAPPNAFNLGHWYMNVGTVLCRPGGFSWIEPWERKTEDMRQVNPGWRQDEFDERQWGMTR